MKRKLKLPPPSRPLVKQLIDVYRRHPCLWNKEDPDYKKKEARRISMEKVLMKFHEIYPDGSLLDLKLFIEDLKSSCLRDIDKLIRTSRPRYRGSVHIPKTWYFPLMTFLFVQDYQELPQLLESIDLPKPEEVDLRHPKTVLKMLGRQKKKMRKVTERKHVNSEQSSEQHKDNNRVETPSGENSQEIEWLDEELFVEDNVKEDKRELSSPEDNYRIADIKVELSGNISPIDFSTIMDDDNLPFIKYKEIGLRKRRNTGMSKTSLPTVDEDGKRDRYSVSAENFVCKLRHLELEQRVRAETLIEEVLHLAEFNVLNEHTSLIVEEPL